MNKGMKIVLRVLGGALLAIGAGTAIVGNTALKDMLDNFASIMRPNSAMAKRKSSPLTLLR